MKIFYSTGGTAYGDRVYVAFKDCKYSTRLYTLLKTLSAWGGPDKKCPEENWWSYEFPPTKEKDFFKKLLNIYYPNAEILENTTIERWEEFLRYCKEE